MPEIKEAKMPEFQKPLVVLFLTIFLGCGTLTFSLISPSGVQGQDEEIEKARKLYLEGNYLDSLLKLTALKQQVDADEKSDDKSEMLAEIHFLSGLCFLDGWNQKDRAKGSFEQVLKFYPSFQVKEELYGQKAVKQFQEIMKDELEKASGDETVIEDIKEKEPIQSTSAPSLENALVRIIKKNAVIRIKPSIEGTIVKRLPLGALLEVEEDLEEWLKIILPPDKNGFVVTGYIQKSFTESSSVIH
jgi:hypothetical protein